MLRLRQAEARLRESEERFRATVEQAAVGLGHLTLDGEWTWVNRRLCQILGYTQEELLQKGWLDVACPECLQTLLEHQRMVLAGEARKLRLGATLPAQGWLGVLGQLDGVAGAQTRRRTSALRRRGGRY